MKNNFVRDNFINYDLEKALMDERERKFLFSLEEELINSITKNGTLKI